MIDLEPEKILELSEEELSKYSIEDLVVMVEGLAEDPSARLRRLRAERHEYHV